MRLIQTNEVQVMQTKSKKAVDHFNKCPLCGADDLIRMSPEVVCSQCEWNSCLWSVSRGRMDNLNSAVIEELRESRKYPKVIQPRAVRNDDNHLDIAAGDFR